MLLVTTIICIFFGGPACLLFYVHILNYANGKTTNERMSKQARTVSEAVDMQSQSGTSYSAMSSQVDAE